jgi:small subunit ribosomal protein S21
MLIIPVKEGEAIDRALKRYKRKFDRTKMMRQIRDRKQFSKPSVRKRTKLIKAKYIQHLRSMEDQY